MTTNDRILAHDGVEGAVDSILTLLYGFEGVRADALGGQRAVYRVLGLDDAFEAEVVRRLRRHESLEEA